MTHSDQINEIAAALAKAQARIEHAEKSAENPGFKRGNKVSTYADLASVWDACREALTANGIAVVQAPETEGAVVSMDTMLTHSSGQWFRGRLSATAAAAGAQQVGSTITYLRRYALASMVGVAPADDDGEAAMGRDTPAGRPEHPQTGRIEAHPRASAKTVEAPAEHPAVRVPSPHVQALWNETKKLKGEEKSKDPALTRAEFEAAARQVWGDKPKPSNEWTPEDAALVEAVIFPKDVPF